MTNHEHDGFDQLLAEALRQHPAAGQKPATTPGDDCPVGALIAGIKLTELMQLLHVKECAFCQHLKAAVEAAKSEEDAKALSRVANFSSSTATGTGSQRWSRRFPDGDATVTCLVELTEDDRLVWTVDAAGDNFTGHLVALRWNVQGGPARTLVVPLRWDEGTWSGWVHTAAPAGDSWQQEGNLNVELSPRPWPAADLVEHASVVAASVAAAGESTFAAWEDLLIDNPSLPDGLRDDIESQL